MTTPSRPPRDNIVRAVPRVELRAASDGSIGTLAGHFSTFNDWYPIDSMWEGKFLERVTPGAFRKTFTENRDQMKVTFNHGQDPSLGDKVLGPISILEEDSVGARYEVPLLDTSYNRDLLPGLQAGLYGASFRFRVTKDEFLDNPKASDWNPDAIPERTIKEVQVMEFGPVTYPASPTASAGVRSLTDVYAMHQFTRDPQRLALLMRDMALPDGAEAEPHSDPEPPPPEPPPDEPADQPTQDPPNGGSSDSGDRSVTSQVTREEKASRVTEIIDSLARLDAAHGGVFPVDVQSRWDEDVVELKALKADVAAMDERAKFITDFGEDPKKVEEATVRTSYPVPNQINKKSERELFSPEMKANSYEARLQEFRDDGMRITELTRFPVGDDQKARDRVANLLDYHDSPDKEFARRLKYTGSPVYARAFEKIIKARGSTIGLTPEEQRGTALAVGVDATGGFTVPFAFDPTIIHIGSWSGAVNGYRRVCRVVDIVGTDTWNAITSTAVVATRTTEAAAAVEQGPTFAQPQYIVTRVQGQITASFEMFQDRADLASEMATLIAEAKDNEEESSMATGATAAANIGVGPVSGTSGAYTAVAGAGSGVLAAADAIATEAALPVRHRFGAQWFMNRANIRKFQAVETTGGQLFGGSQYPSVGMVGIDREGNTGLRLLGYPVNESPSLPTATTTTITAGTLLNPSSYVIVDRIGMSVQFIPFIFNSSALATGQQALYFMYRNTAKPINVDAGRTLRYL